MLRPLRRIAVATTITITAILASTASAVSLFDNTAATSGGTEAATATRWLTASFTTGSSTYNAINAAMISSVSASGVTPTVAVYTDKGLEPGTLVATLTAIGTASTASAAVNFGATGLSLTANKKYWLVARSATGTLNWNYSNAIDTAGEWGQSGDAGSSWFTTDGYPLLYSVKNLVAVNGDANLSGTVDFSDLLILAKSYGSSTGQSFFTGDFDASGTTDFADLLALAKNYSGGAAAIAPDFAFAQSLVPEPVTLLAGSIASGLLAIGRRRR